MIISRLLRFLAGILFSASGVAQTVTTVTAKPAPPRVFIHTRGESMDRPFLESWKEGDTTYLRDTNTGKFYTFSYEDLKEIGHPPPPLKDGWKGQLKFRRGAWWFLQFERGVRPQDMVSALFRYDPALKSWSSRHQFEIRASNFEILDEDRILLFGILSPNKAGYFVGGTVSGSSSTVNFLDEAPIKRHFPDLFWKACITTLDDQMAYAYFPFSGHLYGYDTTSHSLREFKVPWTPLSDESMDKKIESAVVSKQRDCFITATDHPGGDHSYFLPMSPGRMAFIYKILDEETGKRLLSNPDGTRPVIERVSAFMLFPDDPQMVVELTTPSRMRLDRWCWSPTAERLILLEDRLVHERKLRPPAGKRSN